MQWEKTILAIVSTSVLLGLPSSGQSDLRFRRYSTSEGLRSSCVLSMAQDEKGLIWVGSGEGVDVFDGMAFHPMSMPEGMSSNGVNCFYEDRDGRMWVGTDFGVFYYEEGAPRYPESYGKELPATSVTAITEDKAGDIWASTRGQGIFRFSPDGNVSCYVGGVIGNSAEVVFADSEGAVWASPTSDYNSLCTFDPDSLRFMAADVTYEGCTPDRVGTVWVESNGTILLGTWQKGVYRLDPRSRIVCPVVSPDGRGMNHIHGMAVRGREMLVGSDDGLLRVSMETGERRLYVNDIYDASSLSGKFVYPVLIDKESGLWVGTYYNGISYSTPGSSVFDAISLSSLVGLTEQSAVSCFAEEPDGTMWIGSNNGVMVRYSPHTKTVLDSWTTDKPLDGFSAMNIQSVCRSGDDLWIGTYDEGLGRLNLKTGRCRVYSSRQGLSDRSVNVVFRDKTGSIWAATMSGVYRYDREKDSFVLKRTTTSIIAMSQTPDGSIWLATFGSGVFRYEPSRGDWLSYTMASGLCDDRATCFFTGEGSLYVGTSSGVCRFNKATGRFEKLGTGFNGSVYYGFFDGDDLWMSTSAGLMRRSMSSGENVLYGEEDGVVLDMFMTNTGLISQDGDVWLGSSDGFMTFRPDAVPTNEVAPETRIFRFAAMDPKRYDHADDEFMPDGGRNFVLDRRQNAIHIEFSSLSYVAPEKNTYMCKLDGLDKVWHELGPKREMDYFNLPPGKYVFHVKGTNNDGLQSGDEATLSFQVRPPFMLSDAAITLYLLFLAAAVLLIVTWFTSRFKLKYARTDSEQGASQEVGQTPTPAFRIVTEEYNADENNFMERLMEVVRDNMADKAFSVDVMAREMHLSRSGIFSKVREVSGMTPNALIVESRLQEAARLLSEGKMNISQVSDAVGFNSPSYFSKSFVKRFGKTPREWIRSQEKPSQP